MKRKLHKFIKGFDYASQGVFSGFDERNMKVHGVAATVVLLAGWYYSISTYEWLVVLVLIGAIWSAEMVNTAVEEVCNILNDTNDIAPHVTKRARDVAAGAVLILAVVAVICAALIFIPKM